MGKSSKKKVFRFPLPSVPEQKSIKKGITYYTNSKRISEQSPEKAFSAKKLKNKGDKFPTKKELENTINAPPPMKPQSCWSENTSPESEAEELAKKSAAPGTPYFTNEVKRKYSSGDDDSSSDVAASQKENEMQFIVQLYTRQDITHESKAKSVLKRLKRQGLVNLPTKTALNLVRLDISRRETFHLCNLQTELTKKLLTVVPCITEKWPTAYYVLRDAKVVDERICCRMFDECLDLLFGVLDAMQLRFHPVIWKERMHEIYSAIEAHARRYRSVWMSRWLQSCPKSYSECLRRMKVEYMSSKAYRDAQNVVQLHQQFHMHLDFCDFMKHDNKIENLLTDGRVVTSRFEVLDRTLLIASLKARLKLLKEFHELEKYKDWIMQLVQFKIFNGKSSMDEILQNIRIEHPTFPYFPAKWKFHWYPPVTSDWTWTEWTEDEKKKEMSAYYDLLKKVKKYTNCQSSYTYLMEGILDYDAASAIIEQGISRKYKDLSAYLSTPSRRYSWLNERAWNETHYNHPAYKIVYDDMLALYKVYDDMSQWIQ